MTDIIQNINTTREDQVYLPKKVPKYQLMPFLVILNPNAGLCQGEAFFDKYLKPFFAKHSIIYNLIKTSYIGEAEEICQNISKLNSQDFCGVIIISGDGSINECINGMLKNPDPIINSGKMPLLTFPAGSSNSVASSLYYCRYNKVPDKETLINYLLDCILNDKKVVQPVAKILFDGVDDCQSLSRLNTPVNRTIYSSNDHINVDSIKYQTTSINETGDYQHLEKQQNTDLDSIFTDSGVDSISDSSLNKQIDNQLSNTNKIEKHFILQSCTGILANVSARAQSHRSLHPTVRGVSAAVIELLRHESLGAIKLRYKDLAGIEKEITGSFVGLLIGLGPNVSPELKMLPDAKMGHKVLHICLIRKRTRFSTIRTFIGATRGTHLNNVTTNDSDQNNTIYLHASSCTIEKIDSSTLETYNCESDTQSQRSIPDYISKYSKRSKKFSLSGHRRTQSSTVEHCKNRDLNSIRKITRKFSENPQTSNLNLNDTIINTTRTSFTSNSIRLTNLKKQKSTSNLKSKKCNFCLDGEIIKISSNYKVDIKFVDKDVELYG